MPSPTLSADTLFRQADELHGVLAQGGRLPVGDLFAVAGLYDAAAALARVERDDGLRFRAETEAERYRSLARERMADDRRWGMVTVWRGWFAAMATARPAVAPVRSVA